MTDEERRAENARRKREYRASRKPKAEQGDPDPADLKHCGLAMAPQAGRIAQADPTELAERLMAARLPDKGNIPRTLWHILHELTLIRVRGELDG